MLIKASRAYQFQEPHININMRRVNNARPHDTVNKHIYEISY